MTRTSAIFGVVSVLTAAIVGGVFIRKKIIDDILYYKVLNKKLLELKILQTKNSLILNNFLII